MAIHVIPPTPLTSEEKADINTLSGLIALLSGVLDRESAITPSGRTMTAASIASINTTFTDASDRIDVTINPPSGLT